MVVNITKDRPHRKNWRPRTRAAGPAYDSHIEIYRNKQRQPENIREGNPTIIELRQCIQEQYCWWCGRGGWKSLANHVSHKHGINALELREMAQLYKDTPLCSKEYSKELAVKPHCLENVKKAQAIPHNKRKKPELSKAGLEFRRNQLKELRTPETLIANQKKITEKNSRPHLCPVCGKLIPRSTPITCSKECREIIRKESAKKAQVTLRAKMNNNPDFAAQVRNKLSQAMKKAIANGVRQNPNPAKPHACIICGGIIPKSTPRTCSPECRKIALSRAQSKGIEARTLKIPKEEYKYIRERYLNGEKSTIIANDYGVSPRFIRLIGQKNAKGR